MIKCQILVKLKIFQKSYRRVDIKKVNTTKILNIVLSNEQNEVLDICEYQLNKSKNIHNCEKNISYLKRIIVKGKTGTSKSTLINKIVETVREALGYDAIVVTAATGTAAVTMNGNTFSSEFKIP